MGFWSWLFPTDADRLIRAKAWMDAGKHERARKDLLHCKAPEAEALYAECSAAIDKAERAQLKKTLAAKGFHGWRVEVKAGARRKAELEKLITQELAAAGVDLDLPDIDKDAVQQAIARVQKRARAGGKEPTAIQLVPIRD